MEYNRKHGRGGRSRGGGGRGREGRGRNNDDPPSTASPSSPSSSSDHLPRHLQPTASSKAKKTNHGTVVEAATAAAAATTEVTTKTAAERRRNRKSATNTTAMASSSSSSSPRTSPMIPLHRTPSASSPPAIRAKNDRDRTGDVAAKDRRHSTPPASPVTKRDIGRHVVSDTTTTTTTTTTDSSSRRRHRSLDKNNNSLDKNDNDTTPMDHLPDSPEQRSPSRRNNSNSNDDTMIFLYQSAHQSRVVVPKPHETPILQSSAADAVAGAAAAWSKALEHTVPWYQRLRIPRHVAVSIDPERTTDDEQRIEQYHRRYRRRGIDGEAMATTETNNNEGDTGDEITTTIHPRNQTEIPLDDHVDMLDKDVDDLLRQSDTTMMELESVNDTTTMGGGNEEDHQTHNNVVMTDFDGTNYSVSGGSRRSSNEDDDNNRNNNNSNNSFGGGSGESRLLQRARRYKQQHTTSKVQSRALGPSSSSRGTSEEGLHPSRKLPDPPAHNGSTSLSEQQQQQHSSFVPSSSVQHHHHDWDIPTAMSDLTLPTALHTMEPATKKSTTTTGMNVITTILSSDDADDMDEWLESALKTQDEEDNEEKGEGGGEEEEENEVDKGEVISTPTPRSSNVNTESEFQRPKIARNPINQKKSKEPGINLSAFAEDEEDNMEDWLNDQIS